MSGEPVITEQPQPVADTPAPTPAPDSTPAASLDDTLRERIAAVVAANNQTHTLSDRAQTQDRGPNGQFAAPPGSKESEITDQPTQPSPGTAPPSTEAPASWSAAARAHWATLSPDLQAEIAKRESEAHQRITTDGQRLKSYESLEQVIAPRRAALAREFGSEAAAVSQLFALSDWAGRDFPGFVRALAQQRGVDLRTLIDSPAAGAQPGAPVDPHIATLQAQIAQLGSKLTAREQAELEAQSQQIASTISEFAGRKTSDGTLMYPHFEKVREDMGILIDSALKAGRQLSLEQAYVKAVRTNDELYAEDLKAKEAAQKAASEAEAKRKAEEARKAKATDPRSRSGSPSAAPRSLDDTLKAQVRKAIGVA